MIMDTMTKDLPEKLNQIEQCIGLLSSMVNCGDDHSEQSTAMRARAFQNISDLRALLSQYRLCGREPVAWIAGEDLEKMQFSHAMPYIANRAALWALEHAALICREHATAIDYGGNTYIRYQDAKMCELKIRALMKEHTDE
jgi:hypothetical protein